jgi:hypothetical protein
MSGEKKGFPKRFLPPRPLSTYEISILRKILHDFINEKRIKRMEYNTELESGLPKEILDLYFDEMKYSWHFEKFFGGLIGTCGRFYGDTEKIKPFQFDKAQLLSKKYQKLLHVHKYGGTEEEEEELRKFADNQRALKLQIPKPMPVKLYDDMILTYLVACGQRRSVDIELGIADIFGKGFLHN